MQQVFHFLEFNNSLIQLDLGKGLRGYSEVCMHWNGSYLDSCIVEKGIASS